MNVALIRKMALIGWTLIAVTACGNGGMGMGSSGMGSSNMGGSGMATAGSGSSGMSSGTVTGFGSVFVNGVEFNISNSTVMLNGNPGPDEAMDSHHGLMVGMVVEVKGMFDSNGTTGTATSITYKDNLEGPIDNITSINATTEQMAVLGQPVIVASQTAFEGTTFATLAAGNVIEVSGLPDDTGSIHATFIELKAAGFVPGMEIEVKGAIRNLNSGAKTFQINALTVDYASAMNLPARVPANGQFVEVRGTSFSGGALIADNVELEDDTLGVTQANEAQVEGFVTTMTSPGRFTVGVQPVRTVASTVFEGGVADDIALGKEVEIDGALAGGTLTATKVSFR